MFFFVISGFLITGIIRDELAEHKFSTVNFLIRRARRLVPALVPVITASIFFAYNYYLPSDFTDVVQSSLASILFVSNWFFMVTSGYFDAPPHVKPLLHTWTLGVEWQFYMLLPILLAFLSRLAKPHVLLIVVALFIASLAYATWGAHLTRPENDLYLNSFARFYEFLIGSILAVFPRLMVSQPTAALLYRGLGLMLIVASALLVTETTPFPGVVALVPTVGTALLLAAKGQDPLFSRILQTVVFRWTGWVSYSLYLWHWPIIVAVRYFVDEPGVREITFAVVASFALATASYYLVETPVRRRRILRSNHAMGAACAAVVGLACAAFLTDLTNPGLLSRFPQHLQSAIVMGEDAGPMGCTTIKVTDALEGCLYGSPNTKVNDLRLIVWGDSLASGPRAYFRKLAENGTPVLMFSVPSCGPLLGVWKDRDPKDCPEKNSTIATFIKSTPADVLLIAAWNDLSTTFRGPFRIKDGETETTNEDDVRAVFLRGLTRTVNHISGRRIFLLTQPPRFPVDVPSYVIKTSLRGDSFEKLVSRSTHDNRSRIINDIVAQDEDITVIDISDSFCDAQECHYQVNGVPLFHDTLHLNATGASILSEILSDAIELPTSEMPGD